VWGIDNYHEGAPNCKTETKIYKIHKTMIRPVVTNSSETWTLRAEDENILHIFKRQILRKIFGPVNIYSA
jgi:hypothetical protein